MTQGNGPLQHVVLYDSNEETGKVYDTAYTESQMQRTIFNCRNHHGSRCNARTITAFKRMRGEKR